MDHSSAIYVIENKVNGKKYVGQAKDYADRVNSHLSALRNNRSHNRHLQNAYNLYGEDSFEFSVLEYCDADKLNDREMYWIQQLGTYDNGYNLDLGGGGISGYHFSDEQRQHISSALTGRTVPEEARQRMREHHADVAGKNNPTYGVPWAKRTPIESQEIMRAKLSKRFSGSGNPNFGKKMTDEQKEKLSESHKRWYAEHENPLKGRSRPELSGAKSYRAHAVVCLNTGDQFNTIDEAVLSYGLHQSGISSCCSGELYSCGKDPDGTPYVWRYLEDYIKLSADDIMEAITTAKDKQPKGKAKHIWCVTTGEVFDSMKDACAKYSIDPSALSGHCKGKKNKNGCGRHPETGELLQWQYI